MAVLTSWRQPGGTVHFRGSATPSSRSTPLTLLPALRVPGLAGRVFCFRACVCGFLLIMLLREGCVPWSSRGIPGGCGCCVERADQGVQVRQRYWLQLQGQGVRGSCVE